MNPIGGYFELELDKGTRTFHENEATLLKSGRSSIQFILSVTRPSLVYLPFYTCNALLEPFQKSGVRYRFYRINEMLEPVEVPSLKDNEYFIYINYFDLKREAVKRLSDQLGDKLIVDCTQAFFMKGNGRSWFFNSCRKFFGVPDGSVLYTPSTARLPEINNINEEYLTDHLVKRFNGHAREGYGSFQKNEVLCGEGIAVMSKLSEYLLSHLDYDKVMETRRSNYVFLHNILSSTQLLRLAPDTDSVPMAYPFLINETFDKSWLYEKDLFIPTLWKDVIERPDRGFELERSVSERLLPLPVDQRYNSKDMMTIINTVKDTK